MVGYPVLDAELPGYIALYALILNLVIAIVVTPLMNTLGAKPQDQTAAADYFA
jgi:SSS family solute:Na+ symporter